jgi:2-methylisocitrate lyase-like PEP mutase family enzyme
VENMCAAVTIPVIADIDTGYGGPINVMRTMREFERAGVQAVVIEDQMLPKRCPLGHPVIHKSGLLTSRGAEEIDVRL